MYYESSISVTTSHLFTSVPVNLFTTAKDSYLNTLVKINISRITTTSDLQNKQSVGICDDWESDQYHKYSQKHIFNLQRHHWFNYRRTVP